MSENLGTLTAYLGLNINQMLSGLANARAAMQAAGKKMQAIGKQMTMRLSAPLALLGGFFAKTAIDFQKAMRKINTLVGLGTERLNGMSKEVVALSNTTGRASTELADALFTVTSAGQRGAEAMQILERSAKASAIGLGETRQIAKTITAVLNAYGKENYSAAKAADVLVGIVREGNLVAEEIAPVLGRVMGIASQLGISFEEVGASVATFTRLGVDSAEAVTGLRGIMNSLLKSTDQSDTALRTVGSSLLKLKKSIKEKGLAASLIELVGQFKGNEEAMADIVPNVRALSALFGTAGVQADSYSNILKTLNSNLNLVDDGFMAISQDSGFQFEKTMQQLKNAGIELGLILLPALNKILSVIRTLTQKFINLDGSTKSLILAIAGLVIGLGPAIYAIGLLTSAMAFLTSPIGLAIIAVLALAAAIYYIWDNWEAVIERVSDWSWWKNMLLAMVQFLIEWNPFSLMIKGYNAIAAKFGGDPLPNPFEDIAAKLEGLRGETKKYEHEFKDFGQTVEDISKRIKSLFGIGSGAGNVLPSPTPEMGPTDAAGAMGIKDIGRGPAGKIGMPELPSKLERIKKALVDTTVAANELGTAVQNSLNTAFVELGETLGNILTGDAGAGTFFSSIMQTVASFMKSFGVALIAVGVAKVAFENLMLSGWGAIAAGVALVAASVVASNLIKRGTEKKQGLRSGGFVEEGGVFQIHRNEQVSLPAGSAVTSARMLGQGNAQTIHLTGELVGRGESLYALIEEVVRRNKNVN